MTWFRGDDAFPQHPKVLAIPRRDRTATVGLWALAGMWCSGQLTDGFVPDYMLEELASTKRSAQHLVDVGLWERVDGGYQFHDWLNYNPSAEEVRAEQARKHEAKVRAGRSGGLASGVARRKHAGSTDEADAKQDGSETKPRPVPSLTASKEAVAAPRKRATPAPDQLDITEPMRQWATEKAAGVDLDRETARFLDHHRAKGSTFKDWTAAWRTWMSRSTDYGPPRPVTAIPTDRRLTAAELENLLGPDVWSPPDPPPGMGPDQAWEWQRDRRLEHIEERQQQARERLGRTA